MIKKSFISALVILHGLGVLAQKYVASDEGSSVKFSIVNHLFITTTVNGSFKGLKGVIVFDPKDIEKSSIEASVDVNTISTGIRLRDHDLKQEKYFNAEKFPLIKIQSIKIENGTKTGTYILYGKLSIKGITKTLKMPFTATVLGNGYQLKSEFELNRLDFNVGEKGKINDNLRVNLDVLVRKGQDNY